MVASLILGGIILISYIMYFYIKYKRYQEKKDPLYTTRKESEEIIAKRIENEKIEYFAQKFSKLRGEKHSQVIKFKNNTEAFLFACEHSAKLEKYNTLVGIVREISTSRYIHDITKFAPKYKLEIAYKDSPFETIVYSMDRNCDINIGDLVLWMHINIDESAEAPTGVLYALIKPEISLKTGWKIKRIFN